MRVLVLGAHPDDAEFHAGGLLYHHAKLQSQIRIVSVTDGRSGHQSIEQSSLVTIRRNEAARAGNVIRAEYHTWDFPDGYLMPDLPVRERIIREIRTFKPDLVLTHRTCDYHPDHRAVGLAVQDASYLVTVPKIVSDVPALRRDPVVAYMPDMFTRPNSLRPDALLDATESLDTLIAMLACHESQVFDWLPFNQQILERVPTDHSERLLWLKEWFLGMVSPRGPLFWNSDWGATPKLVEAFEISEYASRPTNSQKKQLFPGCRFNP
jgi:N-acetylglucosamine malate deacetylase 1